MTRLLISLILSLTLATTSVTSAVMHGQMQGATQMVICSDSPDASGVATVTLDAAGNPIAPLHPCPDCLAAQALAILTGFAPLEAPHSRSHPLALPAPIRSASLPAPQAAARGPPILA
jgi:hypothetical protein